MRVGNNPNSEQLVNSESSFHRVIIPVYIPNEKEEYFTDAYKIFTYCLGSLRKTSCTDIKISVVSNGSCGEVNERLLKLQDEGVIDELIIESEGIGKINSVLKALRTTDERLVTVTDADVLFLNGWETAVLNVFEHVPKAGAVCPVPVYRKHFNLTSNIWFSHLFSSKLGFRPVTDPEAMTRFAISIGWPRLDLKFKDVIAKLRMKNGEDAVVGCSHFVATYKREVFEEMPEGNTEFKIRGNSEYLYTDLPVLKRGGYRLSTDSNYAYHMGNRLEQWMTEEYHRITETDKQAGISLKHLKKPLVSPLFMEKLFIFLISKKGIKKRLLRMKGLTSEQLKNFV